MGAIYHVTSLKKLNKYLQTGFIKPPVRAWKDETSAVNFSKQTGRLIILRLKINRSFFTLEGHKGNAVISQVPYQLKNI